MWRGGVASPDAIPLRAAVVAAVVAAEVVVVVAVVVAVEAAGAAVAGAAVAGAVDVEQCMPRRLGRLAGGGGSLYWTVPAAAS